MKKDRTDYFLEYQRTNYKRVPLNIRPQAYDVIKEAASDAGLSINGFIKKAVARALTDQLTGTDKEGLLVVLPLLWRDDSE